jgi:hypothetical protein
MRLPPSALVPQLALAALVGCAAHAGPRPLPARWVRSELVFGLARPDGTLVGADEWEAFVEREIAPRLPAGFTVLEAAGSWRDASGHLLREPARVLLSLHPPGAESSSALDAIRAAWRARFAQEAVLRSDSPAEVSF